MLSWLLILYCRLGKDIFTAGDASEAPFKANAYLRTTCRGDALGVKVWWCGCHGQEEMLEIWVRYSQSPPVHAQTAMSSHGKRSTILHLRSRREFKWPD
jgi:hypothetical protein